MKILAIISSYRKNGHTSKITTLIHQKIEEIGVHYGERIEFEKIHLGDYKINHCLGCRTCMDNDEDLCPLKDDIPLLKSKINEVDGIILASPVFVGDVSSSMKALIDRLAYLCHRQEFYNKCALIIATTNATSLRRTIHTMGAATYSWGMKTIATKGFKTSTSHDSIETLRKRYQKVISKLANKFYMGIKNKSYLKPSLISLIAFDIQQKYRADPKLSSSVDYEYWSEKGWVDLRKSYYNNHQSNLPKILLAKFVSKIVCLIY